MKKAIGQRQKKRVIWNVLIKCKTKIKVKFEFKFKICSFFFFLIYEKASIKPENEPQQGSNSNTKL